MAIAAFRLQVDQLIPLIFIMLFILLRVCNEHRILNYFLEKLHHDM